MVAWKRFEPLNPEKTVKILLTLMLCISMPVMAQDKEAESPPPPAVCSTGNYRQFDFWTGDWNVTSNGQQAGTNSIQAIHNGCALMENWQGAGPDGVSGSSLNIYDQANDQWHQTWVDSNGTLLVLNGGLRGGSMVMQGERPAADGHGMTTHRITWTPNEDGSVRQLWEASQDGTTWTIVFDGLYQKVAADK